MGRMSDPESVRRSVTAKQKREKAVSLRVRGLTWQQVADEAGYSGPAAACAAVQEYFTKYPHPDADELRDVENMKLDYLEQRVHEDYLSQKHVLAQNGRIVTRFAGWLTDDNGVPITDDKGKLVPRLEEVEDHEPILRGTKALLDIYARRAKLNGLDTMVVREEKDDGSVDKEIEDLVAQMGTGPAEIPIGSNER